MKALDKVFDTQVITGIIGDKFHFIEARKTYEEGKKTNKKDGIKVTIVTENQQNLSRVK